MVLKKLGVGYVVCQSDSESKVQACRDGIYKHCDWETLRV